VQIARTTLFLGRDKNGGPLAKVASEMITQHQQGHPAINALDLIKHKMFE
jgi:hypothetical protein